jgi:hypothetical protein
MDNPSTAKSRTGYIIKISLHPIAWASVINKLNFIALSFPKMGTTFKTKIEHNCIHPYNLSSWVAGFGILEGLS